MTKQNSEGHIQTENEEILDLNGLGSFISFLSELIEKLNTCVRVLPDVDNKGKSECPFSEQLYHQKEEAEEKLNEYLKKASKYMGLLSSEISKSHQTLRRVESDRSSLNYPQAKEKYEFAIHAQKQNIKKNMDQLQKLEDIISKASKCLQNSKSKQWPLGKPKNKDFGSPLNAHSPKGLSVSNFKGPSVNTEANSLISLGPLGGKHI